MDGKRITVLLGLLLFMLAGCNQAEADFRIVKSGGIFVYPGTEWNMTPEETAETLGFSSGQFLQIDMDSDSVDDKIFLVEEGNVFGQKAETYFWYRSYGENLPCGLKAVTWIFDEHADMESLKQEIEASFGDAARTDLEHSLLYWDSEDKMDRYMSGRFLEGREKKSLSRNLKDEPAVSLILVNEPDYALPIGLPAVQAQAKMLILMGNLTDVLQINQILQESNA